MIGLPFGLLESSLPQTISYQGFSAFQGATSGGPSTGTMEIGADGTIDQGGDQVVPNKASWAQNPAPAFDAADYDFRMDVVSGSLGFGGSDLTDDWIPGATLGVQAVWGCQVGGPTINAFGGIFRVRPSGGGADLITQAVSIQADGTP